MNRKALLLLLSAAALLLTACAASEDSEGIWVGIEPVQDAEFGRPMLEDGTYLTQTVYEVPEDPYADDTEAVSDGITSDGITYTVYERHTEITGHTDDFTAETLEIPAELGGKPVTRIASVAEKEDASFALEEDGAFYSCFRLESVVIPEGVTSIGDYAFYCCRNLEAVTVPDSVTEIGTRAFAMCSKLTKFSVPVSVGSVGKDAFSLTPWYDSILYQRDLVIFNGVVYDAGRRCKGDVVIPDYVTEIADHAFFGCNGMDSVVIPAGVERIGACAFQNCHELYDVTILSSDCQIVMEETTFTNKLDGGNLEYFKGTFHAESGSSAERYAKKFDRAFEPLDG